MPKRFEISQRNVRLLLASAIAFISIADVGVAVDHISDNLAGKEAVMVEGKMHKIAPQVGAIALPQQSAPEAVSEPKVTEPAAVPEAPVPSQTLIPPVEPEPTPVPLPATTYPVGCEQYKPLLAQYDWEVDIAMLAMQEESGCDANKEHLNSDGTIDYGLFQLNQIRVFDPAENIDIAYHRKFVTARRGNRNWSAWYALCTPDQVPLFDGVKCA